MLATTYMKTHYSKMHVERFFYYNNSEGDDFEICGLLSVYPTLATSLPFANVFRRYQLNVPQYM